MSSFTPVQPQKTNKRISRFPPSTSVKKLKFSGGLLNPDEKENIPTQFSLSLPLANETKAPCTPLSKELAFTDTPKSPEPSSAPSTPPTPRVIHSDDEDAGDDKGGAIRSEDLDWLKSDGAGFEIKSALHKESGSGDSFILHTNALRGSLNTSGNFVNNSGSFLMSDANSGGSGSFMGGSGSFVGGSGSFVGGSGSFVNGNNNNIASFGASGSYVNLLSLVNTNNSNNTNNNSNINNSGTFMNNNGSFVNNHPTPVSHQMPPPRPVKRTPANSNTNHTTVPHSAGINGYASGISAKPGGFAPLMRRRSSSLSSLINPFTPEGRAIKEAKEAHNPSYRQMLEEATLPKNWNAHTIQALIRQPPASGSIYRLLFEELEVIGRGTFGEVTKCRQKIDGCAYAIKRTIRQLRGKKDRVIVLREVYGLAAIQQHDHIVRYFTAWEEDNRIFIQMELCEGGTLQSWVDSHVEATEIQLLTVMRHIGLGLCYVHSQGLVHLDIKPENIYIKYSVPGESKSAPIYKIGDLGLLNEADNSKIYMEGDSRYLSRELLQDDMTCLRKSDIFALGATIYELCRNKPLPRNGNEWAEIRDGILNIPTHFSKEFSELLTRMVSPHPDTRPTAEELVRHPLVMMVANVPNVKEDGMEGCICARGQQTLEVLKSQVEFYRKEIEKLQASLPNNPSNPSLPKVTNPGAGVQNFLEQMSL